MWYNYDTRARKILNARPQPLENTQEILRNYEVKLKKLTHLTHENQASSASRHHAAGARPRSRPQVPRDAQHAQDGDFCSSEALAQMAAEEPVHSPQYNALGGGPTTWRRLAGEKLLPKLIDRIEASPPQARTAA
jgi:hypothetical protein